MNRTVVALLVSSAAIVLVAIVGLWFALFRENRKSLHISEIVLFICAAIFISIVNSAGYQIELYFNNLFDWWSSNLHDLLSGRKPPRFPPLVVFLSSMPQASICCFASLAFCQFYAKRPGHFFSLATALFFLTITTFDIGITTFVGDVTSTIWQNLRANIIGAPMLALIATAYYFYVPDIVDALAPPAFRAPALISLTLVNIFMLAVAIFFLEKVFLAASPTYFQADIKASYHADTKTDQLSMIITPPASDSSAPVTNAGYFDVYATPHLVTGKLFVGVAARLSLRWNGKGGASPALVQVYGASGCDSVRFEAAARRLKPDNQSLVRVSSLGWEAQNAKSAFILQSLGGKNGQLNMSATRKPDSRSYLAAITHNARSNQTDLVGLLSDDMTLQVLPEKTDIWLILEPAAWDAAAQLTVNGVPVTVTFPGKGDKLPKSVLSKTCALQRLFEPAGSPKPGPLKSPVTALALLLRKDAASDRPMAPLGVSAHAAFLSEEAIAPMDKFSDAGATLAVGNFGSFIGGGQISKVRLYGSDIDMNYTGGVGLFGPSINATLKRDGTISLNGRIDNFWSENDRLMKTPWELMDGGMQAVAVTAILAGLGLLVRILMLLFAKGRTATWPNWA